jgi:acyl-CoA synthetase (NDP forming)
LQLIMSSFEQLDRVFHPETVAVVGASASPDKVGFRVVANLLEAGFGGRVYPVNPALSELFGLKAYPSVGAIPGEVDLAVVVIPAELTISAVKECMAKGVKGAILISGGFSEVGTEAGAGLQAELKDLAGKGEMKIIGPNTLGLANPNLNLNASFQSTLGFLRAGKVAVVAQSGGMCVYISHALSNHNVGISKAMGLGNRCGLDFDEVLAYLGQDEETRLIAIYVEGLEEPRLLTEVAREVVKRKPILAYKGGRSEGIDRTTLSHTGA